MREVPSKEQGSTYAADEFTDGVSQESQNFVRSTGRSLDESNRFQMVQSCIDYGSNWYYIDAGSVQDNYIVSTANSNMLGEAKMIDYRDGLVVSFFVASNIDANSGASATLNVNSIGAKNVVMPDGSFPPQNSIIRYKTSTCVFDGTNDRFILMDPIGSDIILAAKLANEIPPLEGTRFIGHTTTDLYNKLGQIDAAIDGINDKSQVTAIGHVVGISGVLQNSNGISSTAKIGTGRYSIIFDLALETYPLIVCHPFIDPGVPRIYSISTLYGTPYTSNPNEAIVIGRFTDTGSNVGDADMDFTIVRYKSAV